MMFPYLRVDEPELVMYPGVGLLTREQARDYFPEQLSV
jgi:hypothetical protein